MRLWANPPEVPARKAVWLASSATDGRTGLEVNVLTPARIVADAPDSIRGRIEAESGGAIKVHIIGFAKIIGDISDGARGVLTLFGVAILVTSLLVWNYAGRWKLAAAPMGPL